jgi:C_GCAxxG_C_C family probable redox protein
MPLIASGFAGGIGNTGSVCGAVSGAVMAIGLKLKPAQSMEDMLKNLGVASEFRRRFEAERGTIECSELTGMDFSSPDNLQRFFAEEIPEKVCYPAVEAAYRLVVDLLQETG